MNRLFGLVSLSAMALVSFGASAEIINLHQEHKVVSPTIIRGAPVRCDGSGPLIIHVNDATKATETCVPQVPAARYNAPRITQTVVVINFNNIRHHGHRSGDWNE